MLRLYERSLPPLGSVLPPRSNSYSPPRATSHLLARDTFHSHHLQSCTASPGMLVYHRDDDLRFKKYPDLGNVQLAEPPTYSGAII